MAHLKKALWRNWGILEGSITPRGRGRCESRCLNSDIIGVAPTGAGGWDRGKFTVASHDATGAGTDGLLRPHHPGLKAEARLGSWTGDLA